ncbi:MAG TPA: MMPL family transporter, partial [Bacteroidales bacterium]|nr:MMPL family transporter [Bacteroidales bacterium]
MERFAQKILKNRWIIILSVIGITVFFGLQTRFLKINSDIISSLPDDDPAALMFKNIGNQFGGNEMGMIVLESDNIFKADLLQHVKQITDSLKITHGVSTVTSLTNILDIKSTEEGIEIGKLVDEYDMPVEQSRLDSLKTYIYSKEMYKGAIVSEDGTATVIMFTLIPDTDKQAVANEIKNKVERLDLPETVYFGGLPFMMNDVSKLIVSDIVWLLPIVFIVIALILYISFRSIRGLLMPLLTAGIAVIWTV